MLGLACSVHAQETTPHLRLVSDLWCPYTCDADATKRGILVDIVEEIFSQQGMTISYRVTPWERAKHSVKAGRADAALGLSISHKSSLLSNTIPLTHDHTVLVWRKGQGQPYTGTSVLDGNNIGVGYAYSFDMGGELDQYIASRLGKNEQITVLYQNKHIEHLLKMLLSGRIDVVLEDLGALTNQLMRGNPDELDKRLNTLDISATEKTNGLYVGFTPNPTGQEFARILDEGLLRLRESGKIDAIIKSYRTAEPPNLIPLPAHLPAPADQSGTRIEQRNSY